MAGATLTREDVTFGKRVKIWFPFLLRVQTQTITVEGTEYAVSTSRSAFDGENTRVRPAPPELVDLPVCDANAGIAALLDVLNARTGGEQD